MRTLLFTLLFTCLCSSQTIKYYKYGNEGIQIINNTKDSTIVYSHHLAKETVRKEVGDSIVKLYLKSRIPKGKLVIRTKNAEVFGNLKITRKGTLVLLLFTYTKVIWNDGTIEKPR